MPLGRIVLGVFLGVTAWSITGLVLLVFPMLLLFGAIGTAFQEAADEVTREGDSAPLTPGTADGLSDACKQAIDSGDLEGLEACANDSPAEIEQYGESLRP